MNTPTSQARCQRRTRVLLSTLALLALLPAAAAQAQPSPAKSAPGPATGSPTAFTLTSADLPSGAPIASTFVFNGFGCTGDNQSPALSWHNPPAGTRSLALMVHDPDAPTGGAGFWHWVVINLPADLKTLARGAGTGDGKGLPASARQINTDFGAPGWGGPCPPAGDKAHHYVFTLYALKVDKLDLPPNATASLAGFMVNANALAHARLTATYGR